MNRRVQVTTACLLALTTSSFAFALDLKEKIEVPFRVTDSAMLVDAVVNGRPVSLMFDSGFSGSFVIDSTVNVGQATGTITLRDFVRSFQAPTVPVRSLAFGGKAIDISEMTIVKQDMNLTQSYGQRCDGIMGFEVIKNYVVEINFQEKKFIFHPRSKMDITKKTPDGKKTFLAKMLPKGNNSIEMSVGAPNGEKMTLALDTGNGFYATTHRDVLERIGLWKEGVKPKFQRLSFVASGAVNSWDVTMKNMAIYGVPVPEAVWNIIDLPASSAEGDGTIGFQFLKNFNVTFDIEQRRVWLENWTGEVGSSVKANVGLFAVHDPGRNRMRIALVMPESPAAKAGIKVGDDLLGIEGKELTIMTFDQVQNLLEGDKGTKVNVAISRAGTLIRFELERDLLVNSLP
jgi:hypothetical protein